ncbi:putative 2-aminoethylphosphonate ABC transporter permease subunit [Ideonella sp. DXS29W]|uniref:2-aminoethylphosphonate ABC transporter permease subunit n=1 Tax=Ideonella lacteola TaxID=2984193 RepID=A0ABU9BS44_9BURK
MTRAALARWPTTPRPPRSADERWADVLAWLLAASLIVCVAWPLASILIKAMETPSGEPAGLGPLLAAAADPRLRAAMSNSVSLALASTAIVLPLATIFAYALTRSCLWGKPVWRGIALSPLLAPSLMPALSLVYLFGNQGVLKSWLGSASIYGPIGIVMGEVFYTFPHALLIIATSLATADQRVYEAAETLGAGRVRRFATVTLPSARYGLVTAAMVTFTLVVTDFGVPKVIGGTTQVLALEAYKQVIGQQNFNRGAVIGLMLLLPALLSMLAERYVARRQSASLSGRAVLYQPQRNHWRDALLGLFCLAMAMGLLAMLGTAIVASFIKLWPYQLELTLTHYQFDDVDGGGWAAFFNSMRLSAATALAGTAAVFLGAYLSAKLPVPMVPAAVIRSVSMLPMAVPGLVLGLGYIFCFSQPSHPLHGLYGSMTLMVLATIVHFFTTAYLTVGTALGHIAPEIEAVGRSLRQPWWTGCWRVTLPMVTPALLDAARFFFVSGMSTVSAVIFLYTPDTPLASIAVLSMDDAGDTAAAAAMATLILATSVVASLGFGALERVLRQKTQAWRPN